MSGEYLTNLADCVTENDSPFARHSSRRRKVSIVWDFGPTTGPPIFRRLLCLIKDRLVSQQCQSRRCLVLSQ